MSERLLALQAILPELLGEDFIDSSVGNHEITVVLRAENLIASMLKLRDDSRTRFEQCVDLAGMDFSTYKDENWPGKRFAAVYQLLSVALNHRLRVRVFAEDDTHPMLSSLTSVWPSLNWYEREAFDFFGIIFTGHPDLRRILTDYGFVGHPFRKDFPISGNVEMRYDEVQKRVIYQPVTIEPRENTSRIVREEGYGG